MTYSDGDGAWRPIPAHRPADDAQQSQPADDPPQHYQVLPAQPSTGQLYGSQQPGAAAYHPSVIAQQQPAQQQAVQQTDGPILPSAPSSTTARPASHAAVSSPEADTAARWLAAPAVTATPLAAAGALSAAGALAADQPQNGGPPPWVPDAQADAEARTGPSGKMSRLHVGWHCISRAALKNVAVAPSGGTGLVLGRDRRHNAVTLRLFTPEPVRVALVGGIWAAQLLIFRSFSLGARVIVVTTEPQSWAGFGERATGQYNRLTVLSDVQRQTLAGTAQAPVLTVYDLGMTGPATTPPLGPWNAQLTILRQLDRPGVPALQDAQLTLVQRLGDNEAALAASALRLRPHRSQYLQSMPDDMMALIEEGTDRYLLLAQTSLEQSQVGGPRR
jgi:hypothetical protein